MHKFTRATIMMLLTQKGERGAMSNFILIFFWGGGGGGVKGKGGGHPHPYDSLYELFWIPSLSSEEWKKLKASDREKLGIVFENDGEFW